MVIQPIGPPGCGKTSVSKFLSNELRCPYLSTGELCRQHMEDENSSLGKLINNYLEVGGYVPDDIIMGRVYKPALDVLPPGNRIDDGIPRTVHQFWWLIGQCLARGDGNVIVVHIELEKEIALHRMFERRRPGEDELICDARYRMYEQESPYLFRGIEVAQSLKQIKLVTVSGDYPLEVVQQNVMREIDKIRRR